MKFDRKNPRHWLLLLQQGAYTLLAILMRPFVSKPKKPIVILYGHQLSGNLKALHEQWRKSYADRIALLFMSLDPQQRAQLQNDGVDILRCNSLPDMLKLARTSAIITDHGLHTLTPLVFLTDILFIDVWHGIPFKGFTPADFWLQRHYDEIWVSSPLLKHIYETKFSFRPGMVKDLGYARTDELFQRQLPDTRVTAQAAIPAGHRVVLYAPTWQQDDKGRALFPFGESQESFLEKLGAVCSKHLATLVVRSHLNTSIGTVALDNVRYCSMKDFPDTESLLQLTHILVCDWSSIAFDYLALDRPAIFLDVEPPFRNGFSLDGEFRFGKVVTSLNMLCAAVDRTLESSQWYIATQGSRHQEITTAVYGVNIDGNVSARQLSRLLELMARS